MRGAHASNRHCKFHTGIAAHIVGSQASVRVDSRWRMGAINNHATNLRLLRPSIILRRKWIIRSTWQLAQSSGLIAGENTSILLHAMVRIHRLTVWLLKAPLTTVGFFIADGSSWKEVVRHCGGRLLSAFWMLLLDLVLNYSLLVGVIHLQVVALPLIRVTRHNWGSHRLLIEIGSVLTCHSFNEFAIDTHFAHVKLILIH